MTQNVKITNKNWIMVQRRSTVYKQWKKCTEK